VSLPAEADGSDGTCEANTAEMMELGGEGSTKDGSVQQIADGDQIIQAAIRDVNKQKKVSKAAAQCKKAGTTKMDTHPADSRKIMSQKGGKQKRSQFMAQRMTPATTCPMETTGLELSDHLFNDDEECTSEAHSSVSPEQAWHKVNHRRAHAQSWHKVGNEIKS
jgi:hypothetical protein